MGGTAGRENTYPALITHPNIHLPGRPPVRVSDDTFRAIVQYALEAAASLVSPPKVDDEDEEFTCDDLARQIRDLVNKI